MNLKELIHFVDSGYEVQSRNGNYHIIKKRNDYYVKSDCTQSMIGLYYINDEGKIIVNVHLEDFIVKGQS